jgi:hypothetical protein
MALTLSSRSGGLLPPGRFLVLIYVRIWVDPRVIAEKLGQLENPTTLSGIEPATFGFAKAYLDVESNTEINSSSIWTHAHSRKIKYFPGGTFLCETVCCTCVTAEEPGEKLLQLTTKRKLT